MICLAVLNDGSLKILNFENLQSYTSDQASSVCSGVSVVQPSDKYLSQPDPLICAAFFSFSLFVILGSFWVSWSVKTIRSTIR